MKKSWNLTQHYEKFYFPLLIVYLLFTLYVGFHGFKFLDRQYTHELKLISNITGAVLSQHPDAEDTLLSAIQDTDGKHLADGSAILKQYGYREYLPICDDTHFRNAVIGFLALLLFLFVLSFTIITATYVLLYKNRKTRERQLLTILDCYLSEDYSFLEHPEEISAVFNDTFSDAFVKLGNKLMLKTQALSEERDNTKTLVTDISHQLKTPVSALKNCLSICMETDSSKEREEFLQRCALQLTKLEYLIASLINISRLETSMITLHQEMTSLSDILIDAVNTIYEKALQKDISVEVLNSPEEAAEDTATSLMLSLDRKWTAEALANILDNAVKYSPAKSTVTVRLHKLYTYVRIEVEDAGIGVPKEEYNKIFKRFYRGSHKTVQHCEGAGVGLYLSRRIIEEQGGTITVNPAVRQGSIFVIQLPLRSL